MSVPSDPTGLHRVLDDVVVLPQAAQRLGVRHAPSPDDVVAVRCDVHDRRDQVHHIAEIDPLIAAAAR